MLAFSVAACVDASDKDGATETEQGKDAIVNAGATIRNGVVATSSGRYAFTATTCVASTVDGAVDAEISGPGTGPDGEPIFVDFTAVGQELTIGLGVDKPFSSPERMLRGGQYVTRPFTVALTGRTVRATNINLVTDEGSSIDDQASFEVDCG